MCYNIFSSSISLLPYGCVVVLYKIPCLCGSLPVKIDALAGEQIDNGVYALSKVTPSLDKLSILGV